LKQCQGWPPTVDPPVSAFSVAEITDMHHLFWLNGLLFVCFLCELIEVKKVYCKIKKTNRKYDIFEAATMLHIVNNKATVADWACWCMPIIQELWRQRQPRKEDPKFEARSWEYFFLELYPRTNLACH
jgi:hypothetical protein